MVQWALYLDESGDAVRHSIPVENGQKPIFTLGGVVLPLVGWRDYDREYLRLKLQFFKNEIDASSKGAANWEFKGKRITAPRNVDRKVIKIFGYRVLDLIAGYGGQLFGVTFLKDHEDPMESHAMYSLALQFLAERYNIFLREDGAQGLTIIDSRMAHVTPGRGLDYRVAESFLSFVFGNVEGQQLKQLIEAPLFADSSLTSGLQIADIVAAMLYANNYEHHLGVNAEMGYLDYSHSKRYWPQITALQFESKHNYGGYQKFGFKVIDHRN